MFVDKYLDTIAEQNIYNNHYGEIPKSSRLLKKWHNETTEDLRQILYAALLHIAQGTPNRELEDNIVKLSEYIRDVKPLNLPFVNLCNPSNKEINSVKSKYGWDFEIKAKGIKSLYWITKRGLAEYYNKEFDIPITNTDKDINRMPLDWNGLTPPANPKNDLFEYKY